MKRSEHRTVWRAAGSLAVVVVVAAAGCQREPDRAPAPPTAQTAQPPVPVPAAGHAVSASASIKVTVSLSPAVAAKAAPGDTVFIFARAASGPRMPLAVVRKSVKDLPVTVVLDDGAAMSPGMKLSNVPQAVVVARVSKSGDAIARAGDLEGASGPVETVNGAVAIDIAEVLTGK